MQDWERLLDDARADEDAAARSRQRWLQRQATEGATLAGTILDLAEARAGVSVWTASGRRHEGALVGLGADFAVLADRGEHVVILLAGITVVRPQPGLAAVASGDRPAALDLSFSELVARLVDGRPEVAVGLTTGDAIAGTLLGAGADVLTLQVAPGADGVAYVSAGRCASVRFRSG